MWVNIICSMLLHTQNCTTARQIIITELPPSTSVQQMSNPYCANLLICWEKKRKTWITSNFVFVDDLRAWHFFDLSKRNGEKYFCGAFQKFSSKIFNNAAEGTLLQPLERMFPMLFKSCRIIADCIELTPWRFWPILFDVALVWPEVLGCGTLDSTRNYFCIALSNINVRELVQQLNNFLDYSVTFKGYLVTYHTPCLPLRRYVRSKV